MRLHRKHRVPKTPTDAWEARTGQKPIRALYLRRVKKGVWKHAEPGEGRWVPAGDGAVMNEAKVRTGLAGRKQEARLRRRVAKERRGHGAKG